ncbi:MAG TPA: hypothetical protein VGN64_17240, partial [Dyadobacter sp.]|nr:hypothetical protein [Dyadobacter sp.]
MHTQAREEFNNAFSTEKYDQFIKSIQTDFPDQLDFRIAETPVFIPSELKAKLLEACEETIDTIVTPEFKNKTDRAVPEGQLVPNENEHTSFLAIDFA